MCKLLHEQQDLFPDLPKKPDSPDPQPETKCAHCDHIVAVRFQSRNFFFCAVQRGGQYGTKIRKNAPSCPKFLAAFTPLIMHLDGYYGGEYGPGLFRGDITPKEGIDLKGNDVEGKQPKDGREQCGKGLYQALGRPDLDGADAAPMTAAAVERFFEATREKARHRQASDDHHTDS